MTARERGRQFADGYRVTFGYGQHLNVVPGTKCPGDLVLQLATPQALVVQQDGTRLWRCGWENVSMATLLTAHAFMWENEENRYPRTPDGARMGGDYWTLACANAVEDLPGALQNLRTQVQFARELERRRNGGTA